MVREDTGLDIHLTISFFWTNVCVLLHENISKIIGPMVVFYLYYHPVEVEALDSLLAPARYSGATLSELETQLTLKRKTRGQPPVTVWVCCHSTHTRPKQQFTDHTVQTSNSTIKSQSSSDGLFVQNATRLDAKRAQKKKRPPRCEKAPSERFLRPPELAPCSWWFPLGSSDKHMDDDRWTIKALKRNKSLTEGGEAGFRIHLRSLMWLQILCQRRFVTLEMDRKQHKNGRFDIDWSN